MSIVSTILSSVGYVNTMESNKKQIPKVDIILSVNNNQDSIYFPVISANLPEISSPQANETFNAITGDLNVIGAMGLRTLTLTSFFPVNKNYKFIRSKALANGWDYVEWIEKYRAQYIPFRLVIIETNGTERLNMACTIDDFKYNLNKANNINYSLNFREYKFVNKKNNYQQSDEGVIGNE